MGLFVLPLGFGFWVLGFGFALSLAPFFFSAWSLWTEPALCWRRWTLIVWELCVWVCLLVRVSDNSYSPQVSQWRFNKDVAALGKALVRGRCRGTIFRLVAGESSAVRFELHTSHLWPQTRRAKCESACVDNCLVKIMNCWLRSWLSQTQKSCLVLNRGLNA